MISLTSIFAPALAVGIGATLLMDLWSEMLRRMGVATLNYALLGRWCLHWRSGTWFHQSIGEASAAHGEKIIGWTVHYLIGILFAMTFLCIADPSWTEAPALVPALVFGAATVALPWFVLQPALGAGVASGKTPRPWRNRAVGLATHLVFGGSLYLCAKAIALI
ncbi:DUF2938 family protein [Comamonas sp. C24C]